MSIKIGLIHTTSNSMQPINDAFRELAPEVKVLNFLDEGLMEDINKRNNITPDMIRQLVDIMNKVEKSGVDGILLACSAFSPHVEDISSLFAVPVVSADISMLEQAIQMGENIGVIATVGAAGPTTERLLKELAVKQSKNIMVNTQVLTEAFSALKSGDIEKHNKLIQEKILELSAYCDVILLAQMSMTRAIEDFGPITTPLLTSPQISVQAILAEVSKYRQRKED